MDRAPAQAQLKNLKKQMQETAERKRNQENQAQREELARLGDDGARTGAGARCLAARLAWRSWRPGHRGRHGYEASRYKLVRQQLHVATVEIIRALA